MKIILRKSLFTTILVLCLFNYCKSQDLPNPDSFHVCNVNQLVSDFIYLKALLEKAHPSLYRYTPKDSMDHYFDLALSKLDHPMGQIEFWQILQSNIISNIRCGHTTLTPGKAFFDEYTHIDHPIIPFFIYIKGDRIFVRDYLGKKDSSSI